MNLLDCYNTYKGQSVDVDGVPADAGQCVQWAEIVLNLVYGLPYFFAPGAINWWNSPNSNLTNNFDFIPYSPSMAIQAGDFVVYGTGVGSVFGHIDVAAQNGVGNNYVGYDSNWGHNLTVHTVTHNDSYNQYILGILRLKSNNGGSMKPTQEEIIQCYQVILQENPSAAQITAQEGQPALINVVLSLDAEHKAKFVPKTDFDNVFNIANQRGENEQAIATAVGFTGNPDATGDIIAAINVLKANQGNINKDAVISYLQANLT